MVSVGLIERGFSPVLPFAKPLAIIQSINEINKKLKPNGSLYKMKRMSVGVANGCVRVRAKISVSKCASIQNSN